MKDKDKDKLIEIENRYCPICGKFIKAGLPIHRCNKKDLEEINNKEKNNKENICEEERTYHDKLEEFEEFYNHENRYKDKE